MEALLNNFLDGSSLIPSLGPFAAPTSHWGSALVLLQGLVVITAGVDQVQNPTPYSKFADPKTAKLPSMYGMIILYTPSFLVAMLWILRAVAGKTADDGGAVAIALPLASICVALHFGKRVLESTLLHKYSGTMELTTSIFIGIYYALTSALIVSTAAPMNLENELSQRMGLVVFTVGELGNLYHHYLLRCLRTEKKNDTDAKKKRYVPPQGGFFRFVVAPHYLFEIISFIGIALTSQSLHSLLVALGMGSYLAGRAVATHRFYSKTFDKSEWSPQEIKALIPFIF